MSFYADTSFLFSYYASDVHSSRTDAWRQANTGALPFSVFHRLELRNGLELAVFQMRLTSKEAAAAWAAVENDLRDGFLVAVNLPLADVFRDADLFAKDHTAQIGTRSLDILHVAAAKLLAADEVVTFDRRQATLAAQIGLKVAKV